MYLENTLRIRAVRERNDFLMPYPKLCHNVLHTACLDVKAWCEIPKRRKRPSLHDEKILVGRAIISLNWLFDHDEALRLDAPFCCDACDLDGDVLVDGLLAGLERNRVATLSGYVAAWQKWQEQEHDEAAA